MVECLFFYVMASCDISDTLILLNEVRGDLCKSTDVFLLLPVCFVSFSHRC